MYEKYNAVLRFHAAKNDDGSVRTEYPSADKVPFLQKKCGELGLGEWTPTANNGVRWKWHNTYATTIHAINRYPTPNPNPNPNLNPNPNPNP